MGCDIHPHVERRVGDHWERVTNAPRAIQYRNYDVFAILAGVRNGYGFAGHTTGSGFTPIAEPRGLPKDIAAPSTTDWPYAEHWAAKYPEYTPAEMGEDYGDHSSSWVSLRELNDYPWQRLVVKTGVVSRAEYETWDHSTAPKSYSGWITGPKIVVGRYDQPASLADATHVQIDWNETCAECAGSFYSDVLPWLRAQGAPDDVRLVFGFDS